MRNLPIANELIRRGYSVSIVSGEYQIEVANQYLKKAAEYIICNTDVGPIVKAGTLTIDQESTISHVKSFLKRWPSLIDNVPNADLFIVDIVPWALIAAKKQQIPSLLITNFTWIDQFNSFLPKELLHDYEQAFLNADNVLYYDLVNKPTQQLFGNKKNVGFVSRPFNLKKVKEIKKAHKRPIVYLSLGASNTGLDEELNVSELNYDFISTTKIHLVGNNVEYLDPTVQNTQDYIKASDYCIAKAGWSTVAEAMLARVPFAVLERNDSPEDVMTINELKRRKAVITIKVEELRNMQGVINKMDTFSWPCVKYSNNYMYVADLICEECNGLYK